MRNVPPILVYCHFDLLPGTCGCGEMVPGWDVQRVKLQTLQLQLPPALEKIRESPSYLDQAVQSPGPPRFRPRTLTIDNS